MAKDRDKRNDGQGNQWHALVLFPCQIFPCPFFSRPSGHYQISPFRECPGSNETRRPCSLACLCVSVFICGERPRQENDGQGNQRHSLVLFPCQVFPCPFFSRPSGHYQISPFCECPGSNETRRPCSLACLCASVFICGERPGQENDGQGNQRHSLVLFPCQIFPCRFFSRPSGHYQISPFVAVRGGPAL